MASDVLFVPRSATKPEYLVSLVGYMPLQARYEYHRIGCGPPVRCHVAVRLSVRRRL
jgi:hypothetical protein